MMAFFELDAKVNFGEFLYIELVEVWFPNKGGSS